MKVLHAALLIFVLTISAEIACVQKSQKMTPHTDAHACTVCHMEKQTGPRSEIIPELKKDPIALCVTCHPAGLQDHKIDVVPKKAPIAGLPLSRDGKIVCHTCHDPHGKSKEKAFLRMEANALCMACHPDK